MIAAPRRIFEKPELKTLEGFMNSSDNAGAPPVAVSTAVEFIQLALNPRWLDLDPFAWTNVAKGALGLNPTKGTNATDRVGNRFSIVKQEMRFCMTLPALWYDTVSTDGAERNLCCRVIVIRIGPRSGYVAGNSRKYKWDDFFVSRNINSFLKLRKDLPDGFPKYTIIHDHRFTITEQSQFTNRDLNIRVPSRILKMGDDDADGAQSIPKDSATHHLFLVYQGTKAGIGPIAIDVPCKFTFIG